MCRTPLEPQPVLEDLDDLYEHAPCGYLSLAADGVIVKINRTLLQWLDFEEPDLLGKQLHSLLNTPGKIFFETHFAPLLRMQGYFNEVALDLVSRDGRTIQTLANAAERRSSEGAVLFTRVTLFHAADRRRYERDLVNARNAADHARRELEVLNRSLEARIAQGVADRLKLEQGLLAEKELVRVKDQFVAILGHDLRNPLAAVSAGLALLKRQYESDKASDVLALMAKSVQRMSALVSDMLDLARSNAGQGMTIDLRPTNLRNVIEQVVDEFRTATPEREIRVDLEIKREVVCDGARVGQLLSNLIGNAIVHGTATQPIEIVVAERALHVELSVTNSGEPIPDDVMIHLFEPFFRANSAGHKRGLGLGLFICNEIARSHGGSLRVQSNGDKTTFVFQLPI